MVDCSYIRAVDKLLRLLSEFLVLYISSLQKIHFKEQAIVLYSHLFVHPSIHSVSSAYPIHGLSQLPWSKRQPTPSTGHQSVAGLI